jgi:peroxiredoxin
MVNRSQQNASVSLRYLTLMCLAALAAGCPSPGDQDGPLPAPQAAAINAPAAAREEVAKDSAPGTLAQALDAITATTLEHPPGTMKPYDEERAQLGARDWSAARELQQAPQFTLKDGAGREIALTGLLKDNRAVVVQFFRGQWCPYCGEQLKQLNALYPQFREAGAEIVAISPETEANIAAMASSYGLDFPVLSDPGSTVARAFGVGYQVSPAVVTDLKVYGIDLPERTAAAEAWLPLAATFVLDRSGRVVWRSVDTDYRRRPEPVDVLSAVQAVP